MKKDKKSDYIKDFKKIKEIYEESPKVVSFMLDMSPEEIDAWIRSVEDSGFDTQVIGAVFKRSSPKEIFCRVIRKIFRR